jgi:hypothetical protein
VARRQWRPSDDELAQRLTRLDDHIDYPAVPDLAATVRARLSARTAPPTLLRTSWPRLASLRRRVALAIVAVALLVGGALAVSPAARMAVAQWLGPRGIVFFPLPRRLPAPIGTGLQLGDRVTLATARARVTFRILTPTALGAPDEVYIQRNADGSAGEAVVALVYRARSGLPAAPHTRVGALLTEARGIVFAKFFDPTTRVEPVTVAGQEGYWVTGQPHLFAYLDAQQQVRSETLRLAGDTLLWNRDGLALRLETALSKDAALRLAAGVH